MSFICTIVLEVVFLACLVVLHRRNRRLEQQLVAVKRDRDSVQAKLKSNKVDADKLRETFVKREENIEYCYRERIDELDSRNKELVRENLTLQESIEITQRSIDRDRAELRDLRGLTEELRSALSKSVPNERWVIGVVGVSKVIGQSVKQTRAILNKNDSFPAPFNTVGQNKIWDSAALVEWAAANA